jgi:hypothetical protein
VATPPERRGGHEDTAIGLNWLLLECKTAAQHQKVFGRRMAAGYSLVAKGSSLWAELAAVRRPASDDLGRRA